MGAANDWLIPVAILWQNPGITREEYVELLDQTKTGLGNSAFYSFEPWLEAPWDFDGGGYTYHKGLHGLANILGLDYTGEFRRFSRSIELDEHGLEVRPPYLFFDAEQIGGKWKPYFEVELHKPHDLGETEILEGVEGWAWEKVRVGDEFEDVHTFAYFVEEILEETKLEVDPDPNAPQEDNPQYQYRLKVRPIINNDERLRFNRLEGLTKRFPIFHPDKMFNFSQEKGVFNAPLDLYKHNALGAFRWVQRDGRFYIDPVMWDILPAIKDSSMGLKESRIQSGYTDLVVSSEALKQKAWKVFVFHGYERERTEEFLKSFLDSAARHARAVWDGFTSKYAEQQRMTNSEFLRYRLESGWKYTPYED